MADDSIMPGPDAENTAPSTSIPPSEAHKPPVGKGKGAQTSWIVLAFGLFITVFLVGHGLLKPDNTSSRTSEQKNDDMAGDNDLPLDPNIEAAKRTLGLKSKGNAIRKDDPLSESPQTPRELSAEAIFADASLAVVRVEVRDQAFKLIGEGSGFLVTEDGLVATNYHVIEGAYLAHVVFADGTKYAVEGIAASLPRSDLALLKIQGERLPALKLGENELPPVGSRVYAIGNPQGLTNSLSDGLVSGHRELDDKITYLQTTAAISPGSSGGPLLSKEGRVLGLTTASIRGGQNLNLAVPVRALKDAIQQRGKLQTLASAGARPPGPKKAKELDSVWTAIRNNDFAQALKVLASLQELQKDSAAYWFAVGVVQSCLGNHELALDAWRSSLNLDSSKAGAFCNLGTTYLALGRGREAVAAYKSALALSPKDLVTRVQLAKAYFRVEQFSEALATFESVATLDPENKDAYVGMGLTYDLLDRIDEAVGAYKKAVRLDSKDAKTYCCLGFAYRKLNKLEDAAEAFRSAIRVDPKDAGSYTGLGGCYESLKQYAEAIIAYNTALKLDPRDALTRVCLGWCYRETGEFAQARQQWMKAAALDPDGRAGSLARDALSRLRR